MPTYAYTHQLCSVHASASPFEALSEMMNWLGHEVDDLEFGRAMLAAGIPKDVIHAWSVDPQVKCADVVRERRCGYECWWCGMCISIRIV